MENKPVLRGEWALFVQYFLASGKFSYAKGGNKNAFFLPPEAGEIGKI